VTLRPPTPVFGAALIAATLAGCLVALILPLLRIGPSTRPSYIVPIALAAAAGVGWGCRVSVRIDEEGIRVRNWFRSYYLSWSGISEVGVAQWWPGLILLIGILSCVQIRTVDGKRIVVQASVGVGPDQAVVRELQRHGSAHGSIRMNV
jgi:hypothetical protein